MSEEKPQSAFLDEVRSRAPGSMAAVRFIVSILLQQKKLLAGSLFLLLLSSAAMVIGPRLTGSIVDRVAANRDAAGFYLLVLAFALSEVLRLLSSATHSYYIARLGQASLQSLRSRVFNQLEHLPLRLHDRSRTGELMTFITNDVQALSEMFSAGFMVVIEKLLVVIFTVASLFLLSPRLACIGLGVFFLLFILSIFLGWLLKSIYREVRRANSEFNGVLSENIEGLAVTRMNDFETHRMGHFAASTERLRKAQIAPVKVFGAFHPSVTVVNSLSIAALGIYGGDMVMRGEITIGMLVAALGYILWLFWPIIIIVDRWNTFLNGISATERLVGLLELEKELTEEGSNPERSALKGEIVFENIWFAYEGENWVIRDLSMTIPAGKRVAFFGPTGSGKTTLTSLLLRFYQPQRGRILIDGVDISEIAPHALRSFFGIVQQDAVIFRGTEAENISLFDTAQELNEPRPGQFLSDALSMGEKQLIAFNRARFRKPGMWILDEATAHLDPVLDRQLEETLLAESANQTVIIIAHRLSSLALVDCIFVLSKGSLLESGSHQQLVKDSGFYAQYIQLQAELDLESGSFETHKSA